MQTITANEAKTRFDELLDLVQRSPVGVLRHDRLVGVMVRAQYYEAMRQFYADRLQKALEATATQTAAAGVTPEILEQLLADES